MNLPSAILEPLASSAPQREAHDQHSMPQHDDAVHGIISSLARQLALARTGLVRGQRGSRGEHPRLSAAWRLQMAAELHAQVTDQVARNRPSWSSCCRPHPSHGVAEGADANRSADLLSARDWHVRRAGVLGFASHPHVLRLGYEIDLLAGRQPFLRRAFEVEVHRP